MNLSKRNRAGYRSLLSSRHCNTETIKTGEFTGVGNSFAFVSLLLNAKLFLA